MSMTIPLSLARDASTAMWNARILLSQPERATPELVTLTAELLALCDMQMQVLIDEQRQDEPFTRLL